MMQIWYGLTSLAFGLILSIPVRKFMMAVSVNRLQRRAGRDANDDERTRIKERVTLWALLLSVTFAFVYNKVLLVKFFGGA